MAKSTIIKTKPRRIERRCFYFFMKWEPRYGHGNFTTLFQKQIPVVKFPWPYRGSYSVKKNKNSAIRFAVVRSFLWCFCHCLFLIGNFVMVGSTRFPKSSGIDPKKALVFGI